MNNVNVSNLLEKGMQAKAEGNPEQALAYFNQALQSGEESAELLYIVGDTLHDVGRLDQAIEYLRKARNLDAGHVGAVYTLAVALQDKGLLEESIDCYRIAESLRSDHPKTYNNMGSAYQRLERLDDAITCYEKAVRLNPDYFMAHYNLASAHFLNKNFVAAKQYFQRALFLNQNFASAHNNYANLLKEEGQLQAASDEYRLAIRCNPNLSEAYFNLSNILMKTWRVEEALNMLEKLLEIDPQHVLGHDNYLLYSHYSFRFNSADYYRMANNWEKIHAAEIELGVKKNKFTNTPNPDRRLKIGYVSADFGQHPVGFFIEGVLASHDKSRVEVFCYYNFPKRDEMTDRFVKLVDHWRDIQDIPDCKVDELIRNDRIDILVDLSGHTEANRMMLFAGKPAPIQVTWLGYCDTTGLTTMDYLLADETVIPPNSAQQYSESVWRLAGSYLNYVPRIYSPPVGSGREGDEQSYITFACFNNLSKITEEMLELWSIILCKVEKSQILIRSPQFKDPVVAERLKSILLRYGVEVERIRLEHDFLEHSKFLQCYTSVDVALDTFPYNGVTTTCDALWMGVPVVTIMGDHFISRNSASILKSLGLPELIAESQQQYVDIAIALAHDIVKRKSLKIDLRKRFYGSVLGDSRKFTGNLEEAYRGMWAKWCASENIHSAI